MVYMRPSFRVLTFAPFSEGVLCGNFLTMYLAGCPYVAACCRASVGNSNY